MASRESITLGQWLWIPGSRKSATRNDTAYDSNFKNGALVKSGDGAIVAIEVIENYLEANDRQAVVFCSRPSIPPTLPAPSIGCL